MTVRVNHALIERYTRSYAESNMRASVRITRPDKPLFDPGTGVVDAATGATIYDGPARIYSVGGPVDYALGDEPQHFSSTYVSIPVRDANGTLFDEVPRVEDLVEVTASPSDPTMVGRLFTVQDVEAGGQWTVVRRMQVLGVQDAPQNPDPAVFAQGWPS